MSIYTSEDFSESLDCVGIQPHQIERVVAAWGKNEDDGSQWAGGFLLKFRDGRIAYVTGWCDYTGWGCQDGAEVYYYDSRPDQVPGPYGIDHLLISPEWGEDPVDLNRWIRGHAEWRAEWDRREQAE